MADYKIISSEPISNSEVLDLISKKSDSMELTYREEKSLDYLKKVVKNSVEETNQLFNEILALQVPRLEEIHIKKIIEIMPSSGTQLRAVVSNTGTILVDENVTKILDLLKNYRKE